MNNTKNNIDPELLLEIEALKKENATLKALCKKDIPDDKSTGKDLRQSENQFKSLFWAMHIGVILYGQNAEILMSNPKAMELLGVNQEQLSGKTSFAPDWNIIHEDGSPFPEETHPVYQAIASGSSVLNVTMGVFHPATQDRIWLLVDAIPQSDEDKTVRQVVCTFIDITKQKRRQNILGESEKKYKSLFFNNHSVMLLIDRTGSIVDANPAACDYYGWTHKEITAMNISEINALSEAEIIEAMNDAKKGNQNHFHFRHRLANGEERDVEVFSSNITVSGQSLLYSIVHDITEQTIIKSALEESENRLSRAEKVAKIGNWKLFLDSAQIVSSIGAQLVYGVDKSNLSLEYAQSISLPEYRNMLNKAFSDLITKDIPYNVEFKIQRPDNNKIIDVLAIAHYDKENNIIFGTVQDVTEYRKNEDELRKKTEELDNYFTNALDLFCIANTDGYFLKLNKEWENSLGYNLEELEGIRFIDLVHPEDLQSTLNAISALSDQKLLLNFTNRYKTKTGSYRVIEWRSKPAGNLIYVAARDITERKLVEQALQESEARYRLISENTADVIWVLNPMTQRFTYISPSVTKLRGYTPEEIIAQPAEESLTPESREIVKEGIKKGLAKFLSMESGTLNETEETDQPCKDGSVVHTEVIVTYLRNVNGEVEILGVSRNITDRKKAEEALKESEQFTRMIADNVPGLLGYWNRELICTYANEGYLAWFGRTIEQMQGIRMQELLGDELFRKNEPFIRNVLRGEDQKFERKLIKANGDTGYTWAQYIAHSVNGEVKGFFVLVTDVTPLKQAEEEIRIKNDELLKLNSEKDKFFSIIAHDLKSPFQGLIGYSEILLNDYNILSEEEKISFIGSIEELSHLSYNLLENLLEWARMQTRRMSFYPENFNLLVELYPTISLIRQTAKNKDIKFFHEIDNSIFIVADKNMLSTIIRNLVSNSVKFTNRGGTVTLTAKRIDEFVQFSVIDTGIGIEKENLDKLFRIDTNISRKGTAGEGGTGLGLLLCKEMIEKHDGEIWVESETGKGTTFLFTIHS
ncbi:MAG: PAS domain S-box protein [Ignavibacteria bacterium]